MDFQRIACLVMLVGASAQAGIVPVASSAELTAALSAALPGDEIVLAPGTYPLTNVNCSAVGTPAQPIIVRSAERLGAKLELSGLEGFRVTGASWQFDGLDVRGTCADDSTCEHAFHVMGAAHDFVLRNSRVMDFNAQVKVNALKIGSDWVAPDRGLIEGNEFGDTRARNTSNPTTKLNIDTGDDWVIRRNYLHDFEKGQGDGVSYGAFFKSGGKRGLMERNLVICSTAAAGGGTRIGLSLGGGGTANQFCAPAFDPVVPCSVEHQGGVIRNNIVVNCSDVGVYLNRASDSHLLYNTLIATSGIDFRFATSTGEAIGNVMGGKIRLREGGTASMAANVENVPLEDFTSWYRAPLRGDLAVIGNVAVLEGAGPANTLISDDYCGLTRPASGLTIGALEHPLDAACDTTRPDSTGTGVGDAGSDAGTGGVDAGAGSGDGGADEDGPGDPGGCGCGSSGGASGLVPFALFLGALGRRRRHG